MYSRRYLVCLCLLVSFVVAPVWAQDKQLSDATTFQEVIAYVYQETGKVPQGDRQASAIATAKILTSASDRLLEIATTDSEKRAAYGLKFQALQQQIDAKVEGAEQKLETYMNELATNEDTKPLAAAMRFNQFTNKAMTVEVSPENYRKFLSDLQPWVNNPDLTFARIANTGNFIAKRHNVSTQQFAEDLGALVLLADALPAEEKEERAKTLKGMVRLIAAGSDPKLYGKTLDDKDFKWEDLRGKYVLIKFTATWCGPCQRQIPGMLEAYQQYHDKGLEIVSVYMWQNEPDPVATVKGYVEGKKLPWIIISEELSKRAKHPEFDQFYGIQGVPTFILVDKEGKIIVSATHGTEWKDKLATIFK